MSATIELLEQYKQAINVQADRLAAQALGVKSQTVSNWRTLGSQAEPWLIERMCLALGHDATPWLVRVLGEQATGARNRTVWERVGKALGRRVAGVAMLLGIPTASLLGGKTVLGETFVLCAASWCDAGCLLETLLAV